MTTTATLEIVTSGTTTYRIDRAKAGLVIVTDENVPTRNWHVDCIGIVYGTNELPTVVLEAARDHATV